MRYLSVCSGVEAASLAWEPLGWTPVAFAEIDPAPCAALAHRWPRVPNLGDIKLISDSDIAALGRIDVVIGGTPCQDLSIAGKRAGFSGERSSLFFDFVRIFHAAREFCGARWCVWENVPGALSANAGADFARVVGEMAGCRIDAPADGWGSEGVALGEHGLCEWAVLDAQWFGVAQRRARVFVVLDTGNWADRPPVLLEPESLRGNPPTGREAGEDVAAPLASGSPGSGGYRNDADTAENLIASTGHISHCLNAGGMGRQDYETETLIAHTLRGEGFDASEDGTGRGQPIVACPSVYPCLRSGNQYNNSDPGMEAQMVIGTAYGVRRLTPRECERLQGMPDDHTLVPHRGKPMAGGPRYKMIGNSMAVPVIRWIGERIAMAASIAGSEDAA